MIRFCVYIKIDDALVQSNSHFVSQAVSNDLNSHLKEMVCIPDIVNPLSFSTHSLGK